MTSATAASAAPRRKRLAERLMQRWTLAFAVLATLLAGFLLYRSLSDYSLAELADALSGVAFSHVAAAGAFAAMSYLCLTGFDWIGLKYAGRSLPYRKVALASFVSLSIGHTVGFAALSSGAVRYRYYSTWGLSAQEVAKVVVMCGMTVGVGMLSLGGVALLLDPATSVEMTGLGRGPVLALGIANLMLVVAYLAAAAFVRRPLKLRKWRFEMPAPRLALAQVAIGSVNFAFVAACLHAALLAVAEVSYPATATAYVVANATALFAHVPGGFGIIEAVVVHLLPQADVIAAVLVFRLVYYVVPLLVGGALLVGGEMLPSGAPATSGK
ncbi:MAG: YbhN family protein [Flavobacteriaceae bacterium]